MSKQRGFPMRAISKVAVIAAALCAGLGVSDANAWSPSNVAGSYGFRFSGMDSVLGHWVVGTGEFVANGAKGITSGSISYNDGGTLCHGALLPAPKSNYNVFVDGEGVLLLVFTVVSGTCPLNNLSFDTSIALPNSAGIATLVKMNTSSVLEGSGIQTAVMLEGDAHLL
jgi:hypothetical protein